MISLQTNRLILSPFSRADFKEFVENMLTDPRVVEFYYSYQALSNKLDEIYSKAEKDFWTYFEVSRKHGFQVWAAKSRINNQLVGWCGIIQTELSEKYKYPELQYMINGNFHGQGLATEFGSAVLSHAKEEIGLKNVIATVDIPNIGSIKVLEKLKFELVGQIEAYGSSEMYLYHKSL